MNQYTDKSFQGFFTNADDIRHTMIKLLGDVTGQEIIEPCFGEGAFIKDLIGQPKNIDAIDIDEAHFTNKLSVDNCNYYHLDYLDYFINPENRQLTLPETKYDSTICNPPYGLKFSKEYRKLIKKVLPDVYARESYGLFFYLTLKQLKENGRYVFIMPDTFFTSRNLGYLRKYIVDCAQPTHILQFKSKRFGSVNFGYGNLCIIAGTKKAISPDTKTNWIDAVSSNSNLLDLLKEDDTTVNGQYFIDNADDAWISPKISNTVTFSREVVNLGDIAECKTGIYTGDNTQFCGYNEENPPKRTNGHPVDWNFVVHSPSGEEKKSGIKKEKAYVPFIRGGHRNVFEKTNNCIRWDIDAINFYDTDKKARLQNKDFYFKTGLAVPMVTSGKISASEIKNSIFDQGVVGIFACDDNYHNFLLLYLNDSFAYKLKALIAPGANNSANYLKKMKVPKLTNLELDEATTLVNLAKDIGWDKTKEMRANYIASVI
ncbi:N-6 DNA methylase [Colwellia sp. E2M01]|uniref:Eco57I restriction-modification methylase domain-containing protein n=1 Tax=Colwellia sp. E2M01 TaxID=2841561 RepID=UPI001C09D2C3|nr:N-6 DNA methylase [Colwellia sp. E2M01]MBU2871424.1 N-6 DNA methylase [Colwellia sp. E2M01]